jgi:UDP-N-acetylglucosamine--dolichyl-phosphate N-acetylglucosaminephosphotransferase
MAVQMALEIQLVYKLIIVFLYAFFATRFSMRYVQKILMRKGYLVEDKYKKEKKKIPTMAGLSMFIGVLVALSLSQLIITSENLSKLFVFYFVVLVYAMYGVIDDLFAFKKRYDKILATLLLTFPIASLITDTNINLIFFTLEIAWLYPYVFAPIYIMVVANLINLHSGYNGLSSGLALILLLTVGIKSFMLHGLDNMLFLLPVLGALIAFFPAEMFPAKALGGNGGTFMIGAALGALLVVNDMELFGVFILIPHSINFLMDIWTIAIRRTPDVKYGTIREDGTIQAPPTMKYKSLKFLIVSWFRLTEKQATYILYAVTAVFCVLGLLLF